MEIDLGIDELSDFKTIGTGGFSTVFSAWDEGFQRRVAVKLLHSLDEAGRRRFDRERAIMGQLSSHQNVITPFRAGYTAIGAPYFVMELVEGGSLEDQISRRGSVPWAETLDYMIPATAALAHAHDQGILHRDVKPGNILLAGTVPKLTDFGIAAIRESTASQIAYTLSHCPPETFARGTDSRDERSDLYSAASTIFELLTGRSPYDVEGTDSQQAYMFRIIEQDVPVLPEHVAPEPLRALLASTLSKDPTVRPQSAKELGFRLEQIRTEIGGRTGSATGFGPADGDVTIATDRNPLAPTTGNPVSPTEASTGTGPALNWPAPTPRGDHTGQPGTQAPVGRTSVDGSPSVAGPGVSSPGVSGPGVSGPGVSGPGVGGPGVSGPGVGGPGVSGPGHQAAATIISPTADHSTGSGVAGLVGAPQPKRRSKLLAGLLALVVAAAAAGVAWWQLAPGDDTVASTSDSTLTPTTDSTVAQTTEDTVAPPADEIVAPPVVWSFETNSSLASKPAVADGTLVIGAHVTEMVHAIDTDTGTERWAFDANGSVDAAPTISDGVVYIGSAGGTMYALLLDDGSVVWSREVGSPIVGAALVTGGRVIVTTEEGQVYGLSTADGGEEWTATLGGMINSKPALAERSGGPVIAVGATDGGLYLLDPASGEELDRIALEGGVWFSNPLVLDKLDGEGQEIWVGTSAQNKGLLNRIDLETGDVVTFQTSAGVGTDPTITAGGHIVAGNDFGELFAVDRTSLGEVWREGYADATQIKGSPVVVDDQVIFGTHDRQLIAVDAADGTELWTFEGEQIFGLSAPVVVDDQLFVGNDSGTVYRFDL